MAPWWRRLAYSFCSFLIAIPVGFLLASLVQYIVERKLSLDMDGFFIGVFCFIFFGIPGWFLAVPICLLVTNISGWRFWMYWAIGSCIGPLYLLGLALFSYLLPPNWRFGSDFDTNFVVGVTMISSLATIFYLLSLRLEQTAKARIDSSSQGGIASSSS
jgi:hypothetical protein